MFQKNERMELAFEAPCYIVWKETAFCNTDNVNGKDESIPIRKKYPCPPVPYFDVNEGFDREKIDEV